MMDPFELGERAEDVKDELAAGGVGVNALAQRLEANLAAFDVLDGLDELLHGPGEAIEPPYNEGVAEAHIIERGL